MVRVFCDFDGTVCATDVGRELFRTFAGQEQANAIVEGYLDGSMSARDSLTRQCEAVGRISEHSLNDFISGFTPESHFAGFVEFCRMREIPVTILSDGLDLYVAPILARGGFDGLPWFANHAEQVADGDRVRLRVSFPYADAECTQCGNCKRNHLLTMSGDEDIIVYVGDGISDRCPARYADVVFAKKDLIPYCQAENISYFEYRHFGDVQARLESLLAAPRIKHRREAAIARRNVFMQG